ncbi:metallophosphoesterase family protein [Bacillus niameyensis]|uniref:metallophosphoesterase family protein n=1 Tax=Bacillus niameyensis TaxID=1522308 RepID=UPI00078221F4|nr:DNA repair exonuclease [Bacillus niameyensis]
MDEVRFIHTADLHLDSPFLGLHNLPKDLWENVQESTFMALQRIIDAAIERDVDFVVIVGDLFDGEDRSIKAQARLRRQMERLEKAGIQVFIVHGNHDHLGGSWLTLDLPQNVHVFGTEVEMKRLKTKTGKTVHLYGFSYSERHVRDRKVLDYKKVGDADFHIGLLHGHCEGGTSSHQPYAPFSLHELLEKDMDYWALGHIHKSEVLHEDPWVVYSGNPQGRHRQELGEKGCFAVKLSKYGTPSLEFIPTAVIRWESVEIVYHEKMNFTEFYQSCKHAIESIVQKEMQGILVNIHILLKQIMPSTIKQKLDNGEFLEMLQEDFEWNGTFVWPCRITYQILKESEQLAENDEFIKIMNSAACEMVEQQSLENSISSLYTNVYASRYLTQLDEKEKEKLVKEAKVFILERLGL